MTHTERTHVVFGAALALMGLFAIIATRRPGTPVRTAWPILALCLGLVLFIPVESQTRTYSRLDWGPFFLTLVPDNPATWISDWFQRARAAHVVQHKVGGLFTMIAGLVELGIARGWLRRTGWAHFLPVCLVVVGLAFGIHGGSSHHLPFSIEQVHHHLLGIGFITGGLTLGLHQAGVLPHRRWALAWPALAILVGLSLALLYRLPPEAAGHVMH